MDRSFIIFILLTLFSFFAKGESKCVLVVGGAGYIGSRVNEVLYQNGYETIILDNLSEGNLKAVEHGTFILGDLGDSDILDKIFTTYQVDAVMHFAAFLDVGESVKDPLKYYINNVAATLNLLKSMQKHKVNTFIFSSTAAIFGMPEEDSIKEDHRCHPINPYGRSKLMIETVLQDLSAAKNFKYCCLRYFNAAGGDPEGIRKNYKKSPSNLIPVVLRSVKEPGGKITIFGTDYETLDGTGVRDYIHIDDLATAHIAAMERLLSGGDSTCYNLGNGKGFTVKEVIAAAEKVTGLPVTVIEGPRRLGDPAISVADATKAQKELHWKPRYSSLEEMISHSWQAME